MHIMETLGKSKVYIENGKVIRVEEPIVEYCPLFNKMWNIEKISQYDIKKNIENRIEKFGMFTKNRILDEGIDCISFGISEILASSLKSSLIDSVVLVCDGAGTVITDNPTLVQSIGGHMSGLLLTEPINDVIIGIESRGGVVLDKLNASINQLEGIKKAVMNGYKNIGVTVSGSEWIDDIREYENNYNNSTTIDNKISIAILSVHTTGVSIEESEIIYNKADVVTGCASKNIRNLRPIFQVGTSIPIFAFTNIGKSLLIERIKQINRPLVTFIMDLPHLKEDNQPFKLI